MNTESVNSINCIFTILSFFFKGFLFYPKTWWYIIYTKSFFTFKIRSTFLTNKLENIIIRPPSLYRVKYLSSHLYLPLPEPK